MLLLLRPPLVIFPASERELDVFVLAVLRSAAQKNHDALAMFPEIDPVTGSKIDPALENSRSNTFYIRKVSHPSRYRATVTFRTASAFSRSTHSRNGL